MTPIRRRRRGEEPTAPTDGGELKRAGQGSSCPAPFVSNAERRRPLSEEAGEPFGVYLREALDGFGDGRVSAEYAPAVLIYVESDVHALHGSVHREGENHFIVGALKPEKTERSGHYRVRLRAGLFTELHLRHIFAHLHHHIVQPCLEYADLFDE